MTQPGLSERVLAGDRAALARSLTLIENDSPIGRAILDRLYPHSGSAHLIGITGPPGGGKSSLVNELIRKHRAQGADVAVVAIDPSSPLTGGATLGDRIRMQEWHADPHVFIRSMASRRFGGGLARQAMSVAHALDAAGFDPIFIETVGTGQDEVAIASLAHTTLLIQVPGTGDGVQSLKAGSLEIGDVIAVTKSDRPDAVELARDLRSLRQLGIAAGSERQSDWHVPVVSTSAVTGDGIDTLMAAIASHRVWLDSSTGGADRERSLAESELASSVQALLAEQLARRHGTEVDELVDAIVSRRLTPHRAAEELLQRLQP